MTIPAPPHHKPELRRGSSYPVTVKKLNQHASRSQSLQDVSLLRRTSTMYVDMLGLGIADLLEADARPTFVVAVDSQRKSASSASSSSVSTSASTPTRNSTSSTLSATSLSPLPAPASVVAAPSIVYCNPALAKSSDLFNDLLSLPSDTKSKFWKWATSAFPPTSSESSECGSQYQGFGILWTRTLVDRKWIVIGANEQVPSAEPPRKIRLDTQNTANGTHNPNRLPVRLPHDSPSNVASSYNNSVSVSSHSPRWVLPEFMPHQEPFLDVVQSVSWEQTPVGPMDSWHPRLQQTFRQIVVDSRPIAIFWGPEHTVIYNEAYSKFVGSKHPSLLGRCVDDAWPEASKSLKETMKTAATKKRATVEYESRYFVPRPDGLLEETYLKWSIIPITENDGCLGFIHPVLETTSMRLWERRMKMLIDLGEVLASSRDVKSYWSKTVEELESVNPNNDIPLAILYSVEEDDEMPSQPGYSGGKTLNFEGSLGVPEDHPIVPAKLPLRTSSEGLSTCFREALQSSHPILAQTKDGTLPIRLLEGLRWRGFGDACRAAVICPIRPTKEENVMGLLFLGLNPRRPYDNDYQQYISLLNQKLTTSLASTVLLEEETRRRRNVAEQAAYDQAILKKELASKQQEANESMQRFSAVAEFVPIGMCFGDTEGNISYANDAWYRITGHPRMSVEKGGFLRCVVEEDQPKFSSAYAELEDSDTAEFEFRVRVADSHLLSPITGGRPQTFGATNFGYYGLDEPQERFVSAAAKVESRGRDGSIAILTCLTDITTHKKNADEAIRRAQQAENLKRMAELSTVGMYDMDLEGRLISANNVFYEMCGIDGTALGTHDVKPWEVAVRTEDKHLIKGCLKKLVQEGTSQNAEVRLRTPWVIDDGAGHEVAAPRWVNATLMPIKSKSGIIESFTGCFSDVSLQKWQLQRERARKEEVIESKRLQDSFIDMTSHEMRNPLSAMIHCADAVIFSLTKLQNSWKTSPEMTAASHYRLKATNVAGEVDVKTLVANSIDNGETIISCAQHQKRIVDDILTMSKLNSKLLAVTPITVDPTQIVQEALRMFSVEARRVDIDLSMVVDQSYYSKGSRFLALDPSRMKQVLINLLTNALKFTKAGNTRNVSVTMRASSTRPSSESCGVEFIPRASPVGQESFPQPALEGRGPPVYLIFEVRDTGQGLTDKEKSNLFKRFGQADVKTHVKYGGSGLGLFISRSLAELQRGAIGVSSRPGVGSTFAFFIEAYQPTDEELVEAKMNHAALSATTMSSVPTAHAKVSPRNMNSTPSPRPDIVPVKIQGILVVEDNLVNQRITRRGLEDAGFEVDVANHGAEALDKLKQTQWMNIPSKDSNGFTRPYSEAKPTVTPLGVILMDVEMPIMDGLTCTRRIREMEESGLIQGHVPIIAVSANARTEQILQAKSAGCDDVLVKPYRMPELIQKMQVVIRRLREPDSSRRSH
ncbi:hypothetical protein MKZ38_004759 [Zalerion maritima]|uniref:Uncharacterized protein n=1 Tax=Zalerion maritima TaxID=339359 RepID=A0AAD5RY18_9PEZI|nr:hypothetical protein MKZ38_004759 [Zalerion maritima]